MDTESAYVQVGYLGMRLNGGTLEWYSRNIEHYDRDTPEWTLESALIGFQDHFLHSLTRCHASMCFETARQGASTAQQGASTVQDFLNSLKKHTA